MDRAGRRRGSLRPIRAILLGFAAALLLVAPAAAEPRVALVIGNSNYGGDLGVLPNPANDARLMAQALKQVGFEVIEIEDADQQAMKQAISDFGEKLSNAGEGSTGLFFYAGHGVQVGGTNYLIPVHVSIKREPDVDIQAVPADLVLKQMNFAGSAVNIIILDACRNNPLTRGFRDLTQGLAEMTTKPKGSFISYSTAPGETAADGNGADSPYSTALAEAIVKPGYSLEDVFREVRRNVMAATNEKQTPWDSSSLTSEFYFIPSQPAAAGGTETQGGSSALEIAYWNSISNSSNPADFKAYLKQFPGGTFVTLAENRLQALGDPGNKAAAGQVAAASAAPQAPALPQSNRAVPDETQQQTFTSVEKTIYTRDQAPLRVTPQDNAAVLTQAAAGVPIDASGISQDGKWLRLHLPSGVTAYLSTDDLQQQSAAEEAPPPPPSDFEVCSAKADSYQQQLEACHRALDMADLKPVYQGVALDRLGEAYLGLSMPKEAADSFRQAIAADTAAPPAYHADLGQALHLTGDLTAARDALDTALAADPKNAAALEQRGEVKLGLGDVAAARTDLDASIAGDPNQILAHDMRILADLSAGDPAGAAADADAAANVDSSYWSVKAIAAYLLAKKLDRASAMADVVMQDAPESPASWIWSALVLRAQNRSGEAAELLRNNLDQAENRDWPMPIVEWMANERSEQELIAAAKADDPAEAARHLAEAAFYLGEAALRAGDRDAARKWLSQAAGGIARDRLEVAAAAAMLRSLDQAN